MGGCCCCSSKGVELSSSPPFYHYPRVSEEREPLSSQHVPSSALSTGLLVNTNLETSFPDTYRPPPAPIPFNANLGLPQTALGNRENCGNKSDTVVPTTNTESNELTDSGNTFETSEKDLKESDCKGKTDTELVSSKELAVELEKSGELKKSTETPISAPEEEEVCPTCLEEYDTENPKIITKCEHHFHLSCILEWMERSDTCPVCDQEMIYSPGDS
ncbi:probable E3 ubiquitin-protein ligase RHB1A [Cornus florida]|uniref:probable E3 ubiquitin-protein ligase RHB1A n=1 Tax=Cornus florida TaxID=4283 RepID=UPI0028A0D806|nr:probable E3 ubiquitin-protein ligase RHB1A [Cornus florida]XP_059661819.1 probable E3 ubiquitin-protein ligase RHB1A [Cornus florida]XP_059661820.1 probable E3 ubiquitin-protein ligase RHB1A [Cornus florida]